MATKITKSELKQMIREALREELKENTMLHNKKLKEDAIRFEDSDASDDYSNLDNPENTGYRLGIDGSDKRAENYGLHVEEALNEILAFINKLSQDEKARVWLCWCCNDDENVEKYSDFMDAYEGELVVSVYSPEENMDERTLGNYEKAEMKIKAALGLSQSAENVDEALENFWN